MTEYTNFSKESRRFFTCYSTRDRHGRCMILFWQDDDKDQSELAEIFRKLNNRGCLVLLSNSDTPFIRELYSGYNVKEVDVQRAINCKGSKRTGHKELLISNYS